MRKKWKINDSLIVAYKDKDGASITSKVYNIGNTMFLVWNDYREHFEWVYIRIVSLPKWRINILA